MTGKDKEEINNVVAQALAQSITGKVEAIITAGLSQKIAHMQGLEAQSKQEVENAKAELTRIINMNLVESQKSVEFQATRTKAQNEFNEVQKKRADEMAKLNSRIKEANEAALAAENHSKETIAAAKRAADIAVATLQADVDAKALELKNITQAHDDFKKSIGL